MWNVGWSLVRAPAVAAAAIALLVGGCRGERREGAPASGEGAPARLTFGATAEQAREGGVAELAIESTPDLAMHATLAEGKYEGAALRIEGRDENGGLAWSYAHLQKGRELEAVVPVFGSVVGRERRAGEYRFEVRAGGGAMVAEGAVALRAGSTSAGGQP